MSRVRLQCIGYSVAILCVTACGRLGYDPISNDVGVDSGVPGIPEVPGSSGTSLQIPACGLSRYTHGLTASDLDAVWASGPDDVWLGARDGTIFRWNGRVWQTTPNSLLGRVSSLHGIGADNVWAAGGSVARWDGQTWSSAAPPPGNWRAVWARAADSVWIVGDGGAIAHWDGGVWAMQDSGSSVDLEDIWVWDNTNAWAVGRNGTILRWNGSSWGVENAPMAADDRAYRVWGYGVDDIWVSGEVAAAPGKGLLHWDGTGWSVADVKALPCVGACVQRSFSALGGSSSADLWALGHGGSAYWDGAGWQLVEGAPMRTVHALWSVAADDVWAVGAGGLVSRWDGVAWRSLHSQATANLRAAGGSGSGDVWAVGLDGAVVYWNGTTLQGLDIGTTAALSGVWSGGDAVWIVGADGARQRRESGLGNRADWVKVSDVAMTEVWGARADDVWFVDGGGGLWHWNGSQLQAFPALPDEAGRLRGIAGRSASDVWAVGDSGTVIRWRGSDWQSVNVALPGGGDDDDGEDGAISSFESVWVMDGVGDGGQVWMRDSDGDLWQTDGNTWTDQSIGQTFAGVRAMSAHGAGDVVHAIGRDGSGTVAHYTWSTNAGWRQFADDCGAVSSNVLWVTGGGGETWAFGDHGMVLGP